MAVLHDTRLHHFFFELFRHGEPPWTEYIELAARLYGRRGEVNARQVVADKGRCIDELVEAGLTAMPGQRVGCPRIGEAPAALFAARVAAARLPGVVPASSAAFHSARRAR